MEENEKRRRILVVDDEPGMRDMLSWYLDGSGYHIETARDGAEAVETLARGGVDLVVTDITMPRADGYRVIEAARAAQPAAAVIAITGFGTVEAAVMAMRRGAADFLLKPFDPEVLIRRIRETLEEAR